MDCSLQMGRAVTLGPEIKPRSVAREINVSPLDIGADQFYAELVTNICSLLSLVPTSLLRQVSIREQTFRAGSLP